MLDTMDDHKRIDLDAEMPYLARWAESGKSVPYSSTDMGRNDDTGTWRSDTEEADT
jgi:hypothetical protein